MAASKDKTQDSDKPKVKRPQKSPAGLSQREKDVLELPVDKGWAWAICFAGFVTYISLALGSQATSVMFVEIMQLFETNITTASLIFMVSVLTISATSIISTNIIAPKIGERALVIIAGVTMSVSSVIYALAPNIWVFIGAAGLKGLGAGSVIVPCLNLIRHYFHKRRFLATTLANSGTSVAVIAFPPLVRVLRNEFGIRGTYLVVAAIEIHMILAGLLMRPIEFYKYRPDLPPLVRKKGKAAPKQEKDSEKPSPLNGAGPAANEMKPLMLTNDDQYKKQREPSLSEGTAHHKDGGGPTCRELENGDNNMKEVLLLPSSPVPGDGAGRGEDEKENDRLEDLRRYASALSLAEEPGPEAVAIATAGDPGTHTAGKAKTSFREKFNNSIFGLWTFRLALVSTIPSCVNQYVKVYTPTIAISQGATLDQGALLLTLMGSVDLVSRLLVGAFADTHILEPSQILVLSQLGIGTICQFLRFFDSFETLVVMSICLGLFIGTRLTIMPMLSMQVAGVQRMPQAFSVFATLATLTAAALNPLFGVVVEVTGDFILVMHLVGLGFILGALLLVPLPWLDKVDARIGRKKL